MPGFFVQSWALSDVLFTTSLRVIMVRFGSSNEAAHRRLAIEDRTIWETQPPCNPGYWFA